MAVAVATAVLVGALTVGDSVRGSLRALALDGLGRIEFAVTSQRLFRQEVVDAMEQDDRYQDRFGQAAPVMLLRGSLESGSIDDTRRAAGVSVIGYTEAFWKLGSFQPREPAVGPAVALTQSLAKELGVAKGDEVLIRVPIGASLPAESLLGEKDDTVASGRFRVAALLPPDRLARFSLSPSQHLPRNAFVPLDALQEMLDAPGKVNSILVEGRPLQSTRGKIFAPKVSKSGNLAYLFRVLQDYLQLDDYGLRVEQVQNGDAGYIHITSDGLVLSPQVVQLAGKALSEVKLQPAITYLANALYTGSKKIPYSMITGIESTESLGPLHDDAGHPLRIEDDEIVLNDWAAEQLGVRPGDLVTLRFYEPESTHGRPREQPPVTLMLKAIVPLATPDGKPTLAADRNLTPQLEGVTDQKSVGDWDVPFPLVETIRPEDEAYWDTYTTTPKAFVSLALARRLWSSRYGVITSLRMPAEKEATVGSVKDSLHNGFDPRQFGFAIRPVRQQAIDAARGATSFDMLFLGFSMFLIAAAVTLIGLLFRLGVQLRANELGVLTAVGVSGRRVRRMLGGEAAIVAAMGAGAGLLLGIGYAWLMLAGLRLRTLWLEDSLFAGFIQLHVSARSLLFGWLLGMAAALVPCWITLCQAVRVPPRRLLGGEMSSPPNQVGRAKRWPFWAASILIFAAIGLGFFGMGKSGEAQAGVFFGAGALVLAAMLLVLHRSLSQGQKKGSGTFCAKHPSGRSGSQKKVSGTFCAKHPSGRSGSQKKVSGTFCAKHPSGRSGKRFLTPFFGLAIQSASRNPGRSLLCIGLVAAASFVIVAISAFWLDTGGDGTGRFDLVAESDAPIQYDLATSGGRLELGFGDEDDRRLADVDIHGLRVHDGDDASCLNMYRPRQPRVLGVPNSLIERGGFAWAKADDDNVHPWSLLERPLGEDMQGRPIIPVVLDTDTATYAMHVGGVGTRFTVDDPGTGSITFEIVGLLSKSLLQGVLLVSEENFLRLYPRSGGYRFFLIDCPAQADTLDRVATLLESTLGDYGFDATPTRQRLEALYAVQNTYLSTFQSLGGLGLLLGTFGLAAVQLRSLFERRAELALMRAVGFRRRRLAWLILWENGVLLITGMVVGIIAAVVALLPHWLDAGAGLPWTGVAAMLAAILVIGFAAGGLAVWKTLHAPLLPALRGD